MVLGFKSSGSKSYSVREDGLVIVDDDRFQSVVAVYENRQGYIAEGYDTDDSINEILRNLKETCFGGKQANLRSVDIGEIENYYNTLNTAATARSGGEVSYIEDRLVQLFSDAANSNISDLKFIMRKNRMIVRARIGGVEQNFGSDWTTEDGNAALAMIFDRRDAGSGQVTMEAMSFQSVSVPMQIAFPRVKGVEKLRAQLGYHETRGSIGNHLVIRLQGNANEKVTGNLDKLGFDEEVLGAFELMSRVSHGSFIVAGPTGQGKSTTLTRLLEDVYLRSQGKISIVSIEDPVEIPLDLDGVLQIPIGSAGDGEERAEGYHDALRHFMRIAPDIAFISEIRDGFGAKSLVQFVSSGHRCITTVHAGSALNIAFRLGSLGVSLKELAMPGLLRVLMAQRLMFRLCQNCSLPFDDCVIDDVKIEGVKKRNRMGCSKCIRTNIGEDARSVYNGYERITSVGEVIVTDDGFLDRVARDNAIEARAYWLTPKSQGGLGGISLSEKIAKAVLQGEFDIDDGINKGASEALRDLCK